MDTKRRRRIIVTALAALFVISWLGYHYPNIIHDYRAEKFVGKWSKLFYRCNTIECIFSASGLSPDHFYKKTFDNGEWVIAVNSHSCKNGDGYNATVFYGSDKTVYYQIGYKLCGQTVFFEELDKTHAKELTEFYSRLPFEVKIKMR